MVWPAARLTDGRSLSLFFLSLAILFRSLTSSPSLSPRAPPHHPLVPPAHTQMKIFPLVNRGRKSRVEQPQKNMSLCVRGMLMIGSKYAAEEALKTAKALINGLIYLLQCLYCFRTIDVGCLLTNSKK